MRELRHLTAARDDEPRKVVLEHVTDQRALAAAADTRDANEPPERQRDVEPAQVVAATLERQPRDIVRALARRAALRERMPRRRREHAARDRALVRDQIASEPLTTTSPPLRPAPGPSRRRAARGESSLRRARRRRPCCPSRRASRSWQAAARCRADAARSSARRGCSRHREVRAELRGEPDALASPPRASVPRDRASNTEADGRESRAYPRAPA